MNLSEATALDAVDVANVVIALGVANTSLTA